MAQSYRVSKAFLSTDQNTKQPQVVNTPNGPFHKYMVQVEDQPVQGWFGVLKKVGNAVNPGDELYGDIVENNWGKPQFNRAQKPFDGQAQAAPQQAAPQQAPAHQGNTSVTLEMVYQEVKLVRGLLENQFRAQKASGADYAPEDIDDGPVDLSQIDY